MHLTLHSVKTSWTIFMEYWILAKGLSLKNIITHVALLSGHTSEYSSSCLCAPDSLLTLSHLSSLSHFVVFRASLHYQIHPDRVQLLSNWPRPRAREIDWEQDSVIHTEISSLPKDGINFQTFKVDLGTMVNLEEQPSLVKSCKICMYQSFLFEHTMSSFNL